MAQRGSGRFQMGRWTTVVTLCLLYGFALVDRVAISMMIGPIKRDLGITDLQVGVLMGGAFALTFVTLATPFGFLADRYPRRRIIALGLLVWSLATVACGFAAGFAALFLFRALVGVGEASITPVSYSLISDLFPRERRGLPLSIYQLGATFGSAVSFAAGGALLDWALRHADLLVLFGRPLFPWQFVFLMVGAPGVLLLLITWFLPEPRQSAVKPPQQGDVTMSAFFLANWQLVSLLSFTFGVEVTVGYALGAWTPEYMSRHFGWSKTLVGSVMAATLVLPPLLGGLTSGWMMDRMFARGAKDAPLRLYLWLTLISLPFGVLAFLTPSPAVMIGSLLVLKILFINGVAFGSTALQLFCPEAIRGRMSGAYLTAVNFMGLMIGPALVGGLSDHLSKAGGQLGVALAVVVGGGIALCCLLLALLLRPLRGAVTAAEDLTSPLHS